MTRISETKDNVIRFKEILLELHRGARPTSLYDQFHDIIASASQKEGEEIKNQMIIEGVPKRHAKKWSRTHLLRRAG